MVPEPLPQRKPPAILPGLSRGGFRGSSRVQAGYRALGARLLTLAIATFFLAMGCQAEVPNTPAPDPGGGMVSTNGIAGLVQAPPAMQKDNGGAWDNTRAPLNEAPLAGVDVYLLGARGEKLEVAPAKTDEKGIFHFDPVPVEAGLVWVMPKAVEASKPLLAYFRKGQASYVGVSSTLVAGALQKAITDKPSLTYASFDPKKVTELQQKAETKVSDPNTAFSLHFLDVLLLAWAGGDKGLKASLEALSPGITAPRVEATPPGLRR
ncbi:hypothetical protein D3C86_384180 [compost metagenome]